MTNSFSTVEQIAFEAVAKVGRELTGMSAVAGRDFNGNQVALNGRVDVPVMKASTIGDVTPSATFPTGEDRTSSVRSFILDNQKEATWNMVAEEERALNNSGNAQDVMRQTIEQNIRGLANLIEANTCNVAQLAATQGRGVAGTNPFASNLSMVATQRKVLDDLGAPQGDRHIIIDTSAGKAIRDQLTTGFLVGAETKSETMTGHLLNLHGFDIGESAGIATHTAGTGTLYEVNGTPALGDTAIPIDTGSGTILAGDMVGFDGSTDYYGVRSDFVSGNLTLQDPGLIKQITLPADGDVLALAPTHTAHLAFQKSAITTVVRPSDQPEGSNSEKSVIIDPVTGFAFLLLRVEQNGQASWFMRVTFGAFAQNPQFISKIIG